MSIRLVSTEQVRFDVDTESYNRIIRQLTADTTEIMQKQLITMLSNNLTDRICQQIIDNLDHSQIAYLVSQHIDYARVVEYSKTAIAALLTADARFNVLLTRGINTATIGVIDETVERVTARLTNNPTNQGDM
jgi:hypothetical protein